MSGIYEWRKGKLRVQLLSDSLLRIEERGSKGFEDRPTFTVVDRDWPGTDVSVRHVGRETILEAKHYRVIAPPWGKRTQRGAG